MHAPVVDGRTPVAPATIVAIATYVVVSGIFTQSGEILGPAAAFFHATLPQTAVLFSYLNAGNLAGIIISLIAFPALTIRAVLVIAYVIFFAGIGLLASTHALVVAFAAAALIGCGAGTGLSAGAVILAKLYADRRRAIAFLGTDCAFSATGYVIPGLIGFALAAGWRWQSGYLIVGALPLAIIIATLLIRLPSVARYDGISRTGAPFGATTPLPRTRIILFAIALCVYLTGQNIFTIWAPTALQVRFGLTAFRADGIVGTFFGASSFGLVTAALLVTRVSPRAVLLGSICASVIVTLSLIFARSADAFFALTAVFGFCSTAMFKLLISIGSEQMSPAPPRLVTLLLFCASLGGILAPALSSPAVKAFGTQASLPLCCGAYVATSAFVMAALAVERSARLSARRRLHSSVA
jgi:TsgA-like MFS transporter